MDGPVFSGASQVTCRLELEASVTVGDDGADGGSSTSVTLIVTPTVDVPPLPSRALTVTEYLDFSSWSSSALVRTCPLPESMSNEVASAPSSSYVSGSSSGSLASTGLPIGSPGPVFSATLNVREPPENPGFLLATSGFGDPVPEREYSLVPSSFFARTRTS